jgi:hypothetical protein
VLETDAYTVAARVTRSPTHDLPSKIELNEQGVRSVWQFAKREFRQKLEEAF